ncbi:protein CHLOROPLAST IMPORT APPARATUS 2-like [Ipomoea triloba]|uniref:protein CHLOROPLAST IMPORT APPARATUS 2-like n=1 Tax=Ipomoea triloba TaxID=35885 RepID=UPI00125E0500|nr:protein CHLOROPLAST IMPORT APPARATUS 2-like [Ipomoea triloba]
MPPSCLSGGGRAYKLEVEIIKSPLSSSSSSTCWASRLSSSSPSPTLSESTNSSSLALSTRKPRTPRKRPNQTYHEAAALLSTAYPAVFTSKFAPPENPAFSSFSDLLFSETHPTRNDDDDTFLLQYSPVDERIQPAALPCKLLAGWEIHDSNSRPISFDYCEDFQDGFDAAGSILDGEIEEGGIDSIMGKLGGIGGDDSALKEGEWMGATSYGFPIGMGFKAAIKNNGDYWWRFPSVNVVDITPNLEKSAPAPEKMKNKKKKKKKKVETLGEFRIAQEEERSLSSSSAQSKEESSNIPNPKSTLLLKLNHHSVLTEWMDRPLPFSDETLCSGATGTDVQARLAQIDLFSESGVREASVLRYKEKRRTRLFSKKIRYQVRKVNADQRPRMKGRFMKSPNSPDDSEQG